MNSPWILSNEVDTINSETGSSSYATSCIVFFKCFQMGAIVYRIRKFRSQGRKQKATPSEITVASVRELFQNNCSPSIPNASFQLSIACWKVHEIVEDVFYIFSTCFKIPRVWKTCVKKRTEIFRVLFISLREIRQIFIKTVFCDQCMFRINGVENKQNVRIWGTIRPMEHNPMVLNSLGIMTRCAISNERVIGPYFFW